jgi:hypothetical protein
MKRRYLRKHEKYLKQKQNKYILLTEGVKHNNSKILDALRPVVFYNHNEYIPDSQRYSISGSGFTIKHGDTYLFLTARHVVCYKDSIHYTYESDIDVDIIIPTRIDGYYDLKHDNSRMPIDMIYRVPINHEFQDTFKEEKNPITDAFFSKEAKDITIMKLSNSFNGNYIDWQKSLGLTDTKDLGELQEGDNLVAIGFPKEYNFVTPNERDNTSSMTIYKCFIYGRCLKIIEGRVEAVMQSDYNCKALENLDGMSGSAVFKIEDGFTLKFVGMVIQGDTKNGKTLRFLTVNWITIYLMKTDIAFPFTMLENEALDTVSQNYITELEKTIGDKNVNVKDQTVIITINQTDSYSFQKHHHIYYMVISLLYGTDAYSSKYIYILANIINYTEDWQKTYTALKSNKHTINKKFIDFFDKYAHNIENYRDSKIPLENLDILISEFQNKTIESYVG